MSLWRDVRFAARLLTRSTKFSLAAVAVFACGIAASTTAFAVVNAMTRGLPVDAPDRIVQIGVRDAAGRPLDPSFRELEEWRAAARTFAGIGASRTAIVNLRETGRSPEPTTASYVSANAFQLLGERPLLGRDFVPEDDRPGAAAVVILGASIWRNRFNSDPSVVGRSLVANDLPVTVVGVMPDGFRFPMVSDLWLSLSAMPGYGANPDARLMDGFGRLMPTSTLDQAQVELGSIARRLGGGLPEANRPASAPVTPFTGDDDAVSPLIVGLMGAVGFVLLIGCANVANLLLARSIPRLRDSAIHLAHGATRWLIVRRLLLEVTLLAAVAGVFGILLSVVAVRLLADALSGINFPYWLQWSIDARVVVFAIGLCVVSAMLSGLWPALKISRTNVADALKEGSHSATLGLRSSRLMSGLLAVELAFTMVLLAGAALMTQGFVSLYRADLVIDPSDVLFTRLALPPQRYPTAEIQSAFFDRLEQRLGAISRIESTAIASDVPFRGAPLRAVSIDGPAAGGAQPRVSFVSIGDRYFETLGVTLTRGRAFTDATNGQAEAIVNERFISMFLPEGEPIGRRIRLSTPNPSADLVAPGPSLTIVGVVASVRQQPTLQLRELDPVVYVPRTPGPVAWLLVRGRDTGSIAPVVREEIAALDRDLSLGRIGPLEESVAQTRWNVRVFTAMFGAFAWIAVIVSAIGLYAVTAYAVSQRRQEVGVRMALGAQRGGIAWLFVRRAVIPLAVGLAGGLAGVVALRAILRTFVFQTSPTDPRMLIVAAVLLVTTAVMASFLPARRATRIDPSVLLRSE